MKGINYFEFFEIPVQFIIDERLLKRKYLLNSKKYHPDHYTLEDETKQAEMLELSALNNEAYKVLKDSDKRMAYILELKGILNDSKNSLPQSFLIEMMDINEALMELEFEPDSEKVNQLKEQVQKIQEELNNEIKPVLTGYSEVTTPEEELEKVKNVYLKKKYLWRINENLNRFAAAQ